ncbi:MAG: aerolysin family beta-barrel pore-forming toxin [Lachnospiraceae bacterium]|nr:aerolysin family beta-barrel pore-forming toxin [Lachnospiraceae bacterium]
MSNYECYGPVKPVKLPATGSLPERECYDIYKDVPDERRDTENKEIFLQNALQNQGLLLQWAQLAYQIFQSEPDSWWNHSKKSWEKNWGQNPNYMDLIDCLLNKYDKTKGVDNDPHMSTGLLLGSTLSDAEFKAAELVEKLIGRKLKAKDFIKQCGVQPLHDNTTKQTVFYTVAAHCDRYGGTPQYGYNAFGLAFYNFRLKVVSDGTHYNTAIGDLSIKEAIQKGPIPGFEYINTSGEPSILYQTDNNTAAETSKTVTMTEEEEVSESNSITNSEEYNFTEMIGVTFKIDNILPNFGLETEMQFTAGQVIGTAYGEEKSVSKTKSNSSSVSVTIPPHTTIVVKQKSTGATMKLEYDCPVMVQFDVAVFSMCGTCYDDNAAVQSFNTAGYEQRSFITMFQPSDAGYAGEDGSENLYMRYTQSKEVSGYEKQHGITILKNDNDKILKDHLDWETIKGQPAASTACKDKDGNVVATQAPEELIKWLAEKRPMSPTGGTLTENAKNLQTTIENPVPLYPLAALEATTGNRKYDVGIGDVLYPDNWIVAGYDTENVPFYGFDTKKGSWILVDEEGKPLPDKSLAGIYTQPLTDVPYIRGNAAGTVYAKYMIPENYYKDKNGIPATNESIKTVFIEIVIHDTELQGTIVSTGNVNVKNNTATNLETLNTLNVHVYDEKNTEIVVPVVWEADPDRGNGITIYCNNMEVTAVGTYRIRAKYETLCSEWIEVHVTE